MKWYQVGLLAVCMLAIVLLGVSGLWDAWQSNLSHLRLLKDQEVIRASDCSQAWLAGMSAGLSGDRAAQRQALEQALGCTPANLSLVQAVYPEDQPMARLATGLYPESPQAWFWLGETLAASDAQAARHAYLITVAVAPRYALAWCRLGSGYEHSADTEKAAEAWLKCCVNGDPGSNGCYGAGRMMEQLGDLPQAISYYRLSHWEGALKRAQELEASLNP